MGRRGNGGEVPLGQLFLMMSVGCMQRRVQFGQRRAEIELKTQKLNRTAAESKNKSRHEPSALGSGQRRTIIVTEPPDMLADVPADFGGCPRRSR